MTILSSEYELSSRSLPRFTTFRETLLHLFHNKGIDLAFVTNVLATKNVSFLIEIVIFILDRPRIDPSLKPSLLELQSRSNALLPGFRSTELATIELLGINYGTRQLSSKCSYLAIDFLTFTPEMIDFIRIIRSSSTWSSGNDFLQAIQTSPYHLFQSIVIQKYSNLVSNEYINICLKSYAFQLLFTSDSNFSFVLTNTSDSLSTPTPFFKTGMLNNTTNHLSKTKTNSILPLDSFNLWFGTSASPTTTLLELIDIDSLSKHQISTYSDYFTFVNQQYYYLLSIFIQSGNMYAFSSLFLQNQVQIIFDSTFDPNMDAHSSQVSSQSLNQSFLSTQSHSTPSLDPSPSVVLPSFGGLFSQPSSSSLKFPSLSISFQPLSQFQIIHTHLLYPYRHKQNEQIYPQLRYNTHPQYSILFRSYLTNPHNPYRPLLYSYNMSYAFQNQIEYLLSLNSSYPTSDHNTDINTISTVLPTSTISHEIQYTPFISHTIQSQIQSLRAIQFQHRAFFLALIQFFGIDLVLPQDIIHITLLSIVYNDYQVQNILQTKANVDMIKFHTFFTEKSFNIASLQTFSFFQLQKYTHLNEISQLYKSTARLKFRGDSKLEVGLVENFNFPLQDEAFFDSLFTSALYFQHIPLLSKLFIPHLFTISHNVIKTALKSPFCRIQLISWLFQTFLHPSNQFLTQLHPSNKKIQNYNTTNFDVNKMTHPVQTYHTIDSLIDIRSSEYSDNVWCIILLNSSLPTPIQFDLLCFTYTFYQNYSKNLPIHSALKNDMLLVDLVPNNDTYLTKTSSSVSFSSSQTSTSNSSSFSPSTPHPYKHVNNPPTQSNYSSLQPEIQFNIFSQIILPALIQTFHQSLCLHLDASVIPSVLPSVLPSSQSHNTTPISNNFRIPISANHPALFYLNAQFQFHPTPSLSTQYFPFQLLQFILSTQLISTKSWTQLTSVHGINSCLDLLLLVTKEFYTDLFIHTFNTRFSTSSQTFIHTQAIELMKFILYNPQHSAPLLLINTKFQSYEYVLQSPSTVSKLTSTMSFETVLQSISGTSIIKQVFLPFYIRIYSSRNIPLLHYISTTFKSIIEFMGMELKLSLLQSIIYLPPPFFDLSDFIHIPSPSDLLQPHQLALLPSSQTSLQEIGKEDSKKKHQTWKSSIKEYEKSLTQNHHSAFNSYNRFQIQFQSDINQCLAYSKPQTTLTTATQHATLHLSKSLCLIHFETMCCDSKLLKQSVCNLFHFEDIMIDGHQYGIENLPALDCIRQNIYGEIPEGYHPINDFSTTPQLLQSQNDPQAENNTTSDFFFIKGPHQAPILFHPIPPTKTELEPLTDKEKEIILQGYRKAVLEYKEHQLSQQFLTQQGLLKIASPFSLNDSYDITDDTSEELINQNGLESFLGFQRGIIYLETLLCMNVTNPTSLRSTTLSQLDILWKTFTIRKNIKFPTGNESIVEEESPARLFSILLTSIPLQHLPYLPYTIPNPIFSTIFSQLSPQPAYPHLYGIFKTMLGNSIYQIIPTYNTAHFTSHIRPLLSTNPNLIEFQQSYQYHSLVCGLMNNDEALLNSQPFTQFTYNQAYTTTQFVSPLQSLTMLISYQDMIANEFINILGTVDQKELSFISDNFVQYTNNIFAPHTLLGKYSILRSNYFHQLKIQCSAEKKSKHPYSIDEYFPTQKAPYNPYSFQSTHHRFPDILHTNSESTTVKPISNNNILDFQSLCAMMELQTKSLPTSYLSTLQQFILTPSPRPKTITSPSSNHPKTNFISSLFTLFGSSSQFDSSASFRDPIPYFTPFMSKYTQDIITTIISAAIVSNMIEKEGSEKGMIDFAAQDAQYAEIYFAWSKKEVVDSLCTLPPLKPVHLVRSLQSHSTLLTQNEQHLTPQYSSKTQLPPHPTQLYISHFSPSSRSLSLLLQHYQQIFPINRPFFRFIINRPILHASCAYDLFDLYLKEGKFDGGHVVYDPSTFEQYSQFLFLSQEAQTQSETHTLIQIQNKSHPTLSSLFPNIVLFPPQKQLQLLRIYCPASFPMCSKSHIITPWYEQPLHYIDPHSTILYSSEYKIYKYWLYSLHKLFPTSNDTDIILQSRHNQLVEQYQLYLHEPTSYMSLTVDKLMTKKAMNAASSFATGAVTTGMTAYQYVEDGLRQSLQIYQSYIKPTIIPALATTAALYSTAILGAYVYQLYKSIYPSASLVQPIKMKMKRGQGQGQGQGQGHQFHKVYENINDYDKDFDNTFSVDNNDENFQNDSDSDDFGNDNFQSSENTTAKNLSRSPSANRVNNNTRGNDDNQQDIFDDEHQQYYIPSSKKLASDSSSTNSPRKYTRPY